MTPRKPKRRSDEALRKSYERDAEAVERRLQTEYPTITARAKTDGAKIHWGMGPGD